MKLILSALSILFYLSASAQTQWDYVAYGEVTCNNEQVKLEGAVVTLFKNGSSAGQQVTKKNGKYTFVLAPDHDYVISYTKAGFITKRIFISTKNVPQERSKFGFSKQPIDVDLFEMPADPTIVAKINELLTEPMGKFVYVPSAQDFDFDQKYANEVKKKLKELLKIKEELDKKKQDKDYQDAQFQTYINTGNALYDQGKFNDALGAYTNALNINPGDASLLAKIELTKKKLKEEEDRKALFEKYLAVIKEADILFKAADWNGAKAKYEAALAIVSTEKYPKDQINLCQIEIDKAKSNADAKAKYDAAVKEADDFFKISKYQEAITSYNKALGFIPTEKYPKDQIGLCQIKLKELTDLENKYLIALQKGDNAFKIRDWTTAKTAYNDALGIKPAEKYPRDQLDLIAKEELKDGVEKQYAGIMAKADALFKAKDWTNAKSTYEEALKLKAAEKYPKDQIILCQTEIDKINLDKEVQAKYDAAIKIADEAFGAKSWEVAITAYQKAIGFRPGEKYPSDQIFLAKSELEKIKGQKDLLAKYDAAIKEGDDAFKLKKYDAAIVGYKKALGFKAGEPYPSGQIDLCNAEIEKLKTEKELMAQYNAAIKEGDDAYKLKKWEAAVTGYTKALGIKNGEKYPTDQIVLCNAELDKINDSKTRYAAAIKEGDDAFKSKQWETAITSYQKALGIKTGEKYPTDQINLAKIELDKIKNQKDLQAKYDAAVKEGDNAFNQKNWDAAITGYNKALGIKAGESYPTTQLKLCNAELEKILAGKDLLAKYNAALKEGDNAFTLKKWDAAVIGYSKALGFMPEEPYPPKQIEICNAELDKIRTQKDIETKYNAAIKAGDDAFRVKKWEDAAGSYTSALELKAGSKYPTDQLALCNKELEKLRSQKDLEEKYSTAIKNGNSNFDAKEYGTAKTFYEEALTYKPSEKLPKDKLLQIANLIAADKKYTDAIARADKHFANSDWKSAKSEYTAALQIRTESYPKDQVAICDQKMLDLKSSLENQKKYDIAIKEADLLYKNKDWNNALNKYTEASGYKPTENYPKDRITEINGILAKIKSEQDKLKAEKEMNDKYIAAVNAGDVFYAKKEYLNARLKYEEARIIFPTQPYPPAMITKCDQFLKSDPKEKEYHGYILQGDKAFKENKLLDAKDFYTAALDVKPEEKYPANKIKEIDAILKDKQLNTEKDMAIKEYNRLVKEADKLFADRNWEKAKIIYGRALSLQPVEQWPKERMAQCDAFLKPGNDPTKPDNQVYQTDADYEKARKKRFTEMTAKFGGPGRYEVPATSDGYKTVTEIVIITETDATIYKKVEFKFGQTTCYKNDIAINPAEYETAVNQQQ